MTSTSVKQQVIVQTKFVILITPSAKTNQPAVFSARARWATLQMSNLLSKLAKELLALMLMSAIGFRTRHVQQNKLNALTQTDRLCAAVQAGSKVMLSATVLILMNVPTLR
jgi:hypothetical protein